MGNMVTLLKNSEKYALVALRASVEVPSLLHFDGPPALWASSASPLQLDDHWVRWLGSIRARNLADANLLLIAKAPSTALAILDDENAELERSVYWFHMGLLLSCRLTTFDEPLMLTGAIRDGRAEVRRVSNPSRAAPVLGLSAEPATPDRLRRASTIAAAFREWGASGGSWRFNRVLQIYAAARATPDPLERIHQFSRCIDGLILPDVGKTRRQFISRTEVFIGPREHVEMGEIYDIRSKVEHLREYEILEPPARTTRVAILRKAALMEHLSRHCIHHILASKSLWPHFSSPDALERFWKLPLDHRRKVWGPQTDLSSALADFHPENIRDSDLGLG